MFSPRVLAILVLSSFAIAMIVNPSYYLDSARRGLSLYATTVLPSLFPFYFCSLLLTKIGAAKTLSLIFEKPMKKLYSTPKESAYVMLLSMISGYPVGASCAKELYLAGVLTKSDVKAISAFASTSGPIFMLGTLGTAVFQNARVGVIILVSHYLAALINGLFYKVKPSSKSSSAVAVQAIKGADEALGESVAQSTVAMLTLGGYIVLAGIVVDTLSLIGVDSALQRMLGEKAQPIIALIFGFIEMTRGSIECAKCSFVPLGVALASATVSFGGLSILFQQYAFLSPCGMKLREIFLRKLTQSLLCFSIAFAISFLFSYFL
ncbi:MAG: hypothetical protein IK048_03440 [Clostridia bacterium]|nr:hypothetical protein [Clostridia bacterium]